MKRILTICLIVGLFGCSPDTNTQLTQFDNLMNSIVYTRDSASGVCFAFIGSEYYEGGVDARTMTCVPCTDSVMKLINKPNLNYKAP